jgi:hypothetical protein
MMKKNPGISNHNLIADILLLVLVVLVVVVQPFAPTGLG